jgi:hypothetical protein
MTIELQIHDQNRGANKHLPTINFFVLSIQNICFSMVYIKWMLFLLYLKGLIH